MTTLEPSRGDATQPAQNAHGIPTNQVVTLCGSTRFKRAFQEWAARLTLEGNNVVFSVSVWAHNSDGFEPTGDDKTTLDAIHLRKISCSDCIFVLNVGGYIGKSTSNEIRYTQSLNKPVYFLNTLFPEWRESDCKYV